VMLFIRLENVVFESGKQGADLRKLSGTIQNDILKEYIARGTYIYPPRPAMRRSVATNTAASTNPRAMQANTHHGQCS